MTVTVGFPSSMFSSDSSQCVHSDLTKVAETLGRLLGDAKWTLVTAESCTGGWAAQTITSVAGSSGWFDRGFVTYSNVAKQKMLGVRVASLRNHGAVSEAVVKQMALGAIKKSAADCALAITGIAGPEGGSEEKPVGTVWFAWAFADQVETAMMIFPGDRQQVRHGATMIALQGLCARIPRWVKRDLSAEVS